MNKIKINIENKDFSIKIGFGVMMQYEDEMNKPITSINSTKDIIKLIYIALQYNNDDFDLDFKYFVDEVIDNQPDIITKVTELLMGKNENSDKKK